jgi:hypothetical protein
MYNKTIRLGANFLLLIFIRRIALEWALHHILIATFLALDDLIVNEDFGQ